MKSRLLFTTALCAGLLAIGFGMNASAAPSAMSENFVKNAAIGGDFEIESSKLALTKSNSANIKEFAQKMIDDHTEASNKLRSVASISQSYPAMVSGKLDDAHQKKLDALNNSNGPTFDTMYIDDQKDAHKEAVSLFEKYSKSGDDANLKTFASDTLPTLQEHQQHVMNLKP